jgi:hypothetical protein
MQLCHLLIMYQLASAKLNFYTFFDNPYYFARHGARRPIFGVHVVHK